MRSVRTAFPASNAVLVRPMTGIEYTRLGGIRIFEGWISVAVDLRRIGVEGPELSRNEGTGLWLHPAFGLYVLSDNRCEERISVALS